MLAFARTIGKSVCKGCSRLLAKGKTLAVVGSAFAITALAPSAHADPIAGLDSLETKLTAVSGKIDGISLLIIGIALGLVILAVVLKVMKNGKKV